jgi:hypothetical protein
MSKATAEESRRSTKSLKEQNRSVIWTVIALNALFFYAVVEANAVRLNDFRTLFSDPEKLVPVGVAVLVATVLNGILTADMKARLVFFRWNHALPGHRAFSHYAGSDPRVGLVALRKIVGGLFPIDPVDQNRAWYRLFKTVQKEPAVEQVHRDYLLLRDYTGLAALFLIFYGAVGLYAISSLNVVGIYVGCLIAQYLVVRQAASNYGVRFVTTVLAQKAAVTPTASPRIKKASLKKA